MSVNKNQRRIIMTKRLVLLLKNIVNINSIVTDNIINIITVL